MGWLRAAADPERRTLATESSGGLGGSSSPAWSRVESGTCSCWEDDPDAAVWAAAQTPHAGGPAGPVGAAHSQGGGSAVVCDGRPAGELRTGSHVQPLCPLASGDAGFSLRPRQLTHASLLATLRDADLPRGSWVPEVYPRRRAACSLCGPSDPQWRGALVGGFGVERWTQEHTV